MKRFTLLLLGACLFSFSMMAQLAPPSTDVSAPETKSGSVSAIAPYGTGIVFVSSNGTNDIISYTIDGSSFTDAESLEPGTVAGLNGWIDGNISFYLGDDASGIGLRKLENGSASLIDGPNPINPTQKPSSGVLRYTGDGGPLYFYNYYDMFDPMNGDVYLPSYTDGTNPNTANYSAYNAYMINGMPQGAMFNGSLYIAGATGGFFPSPKLYAFDGINLTEVHSGDEQTYYGYASTFNHLFFLQGNYGDFSDAALYTLNTEGVVERMMNNGMDVLVDDAMPMQVLNNKVLAVVEDKLTSITWDMDFGTMTWGWKFESFHINAEGESDNITDFVISGNYVYVLGAKTGSETELFVLNPNEGTYVSAMPSNIAPSDAFSNLTAIDGGVAFLSNNGTSDVVYVADGNDGNTKQLLFEGQPILSINDLYGAGGKLYMFAENGTDTDIYQYTPSFATQTVTVTVTDELTTNPIQFANVVFNTGLQTYSGTTDVNGQVVIENVPYGYLNVTVDASGSGTDYVKIDEELWVGASTMEVNYSLITGKQFTVGVKDSQTNQDVYDVTVTFVNQSDASSYSTTITMNSWTGQPDNNTLIVPNGTYDVTVEHESYTTYIESDVVVDENSSSFVFNINSISTGIGGAELLKVVLYPNPATDILNIDSTVEITKIEIYAVSGSLVKSINNNIITSINISELSKGLYIIIATDVKGHTSMMKVNKL